MSYEDRWHDAMAKAIVKRDNIPYDEALKMVLKAKSRIEDGGEDQDTVLDELLHDIGPITKE